MISKKTIQIDSDKILDFSAFKEEQENYTSELAKAPKSRLLVFTENGDLVKTYNSISEAANDYNTTYWGIYKHLSNNKIKVIEGQVFILEMNFNNDTVNFLIKARSKKTRDKDND